MAKLVLNQDLVEAAVVGGSFYGGGGGGALSTGRDMGKLAVTLGDPYLVDITDVPDDAVLLTVSAVGAPAAKGSHAKAYHYLKAVEISIKNTGLQVYGFITNECGGLATVNGWVQSAGFGLPVVDVPCNGRAHPTGLMGSMGLHKVPSYVSIQVAVGGSHELGTYVEVIVKGKIQQAANIIRQAAVQAGGLVAVARNPVRAAYARDHAAPGAVNQCIKVGKAMLEALKRSPLEAIEAAAETAGGKIVGKGKVVQKELQTTGGFDVGRIVVDDGSDLSFWNEYMTLEKHGSRIATFPDLIVTLDCSTGLPVSSAEIQTSQEVAVVVVPKKNLILGAGVKDEDLYQVVEKITGKEIIRYTFNQR